MSKGYWKKYEEVDKEILKTLGKGEIMTAHILWLELNQRGIKISYGSIQRRLESLKVNQKIKLLENSISNQKIWVENNFLRE